MKQYILFSLLVSFMSACDSKTNTKALGAEVGKINCKVTKLLNEGKQEGPEMTALVEEAKKLQAQKKGFSKKDEKDYWVALKAIKYGCK